MAIGVITFLTKRSEDQEMKFDEVNPELRKNKKRCNYAI